MLVFSGCLTVWSPQMSVGPSRVSTPPSTPFSVGLILFLNITGSGGYLKTYWEVNSSTTWLASSSCKSTSRMFCELFNYFWKHPFLQPNIQGTFFFFSGQIWDFLIYSHSSLSSFRVITYLLWQITQGRKELIEALREQIVNVSPEIIRTSL